MLERVQESDEEENSEQVDVERTIERGLLLFFSGNIQHSVRPSEFEGYRYCVAGNYHDTN